HAPRTARLGSLEDVQDILAAATRADGLPPISDGLLEAAASGTAVVLGVLAGAQDTAAGSAGPAEASGADPDTAGDRVVGVGVAALQGERWAAEAVVDPDHRGRGLGRVLVTDLDRAARSTGGSPWFWSHGDHPAAAHMAAT